MRSLFILIVLTVISFGIQAGSIKMVHVPYQPVLADELTVTDDESCQVHARISAKAYQNATVLGITLEEQLEIWDTFTLSEDANAWTATELIAHRNLIIVAWGVAKKYPEMDPNEYGDYVYSSCAYGKLSVPKYKF